MDLGMTRPRSSRSRHGTLKARRQASPDSACEQASGPDDPSEEGGGSERRWKVRRAGAPSARNQSEDGVVTKGVVCQDSDVDSGIVACRKPGQRIGSTSSADTDSSQESRRKVEYSPPIQKNDLPTKSRSINGSLRSTKHSSCSNGGPVKGDHSVLKECNRRPPTPLTIFPESHHCVRFDEQLQLSEQNIRRSCRKLFATLYAQRFSYPGHQGTCLQQHHREANSTRVRSRTVPELELRRYSPNLSTIRSNKENLSVARTPVEGRRSASSLGWSTSRSQTSISSHKSNSDLNLNAKLVASPYAQRRHLQPHNTFTTDHKDRSACRTASTDSGLGGFPKTGQCTCHSRPPAQYFAPSQTSGSPSPYSCNCICSCTSKTLPRPIIQKPPSCLGLVKSSSCSTLSALATSSRAHPSPVKTLKKTPVQVETAPKSDKAFHKTSSCSNLLDGLTLGASKNVRRPSMQIEAQSSRDEQLQITSSCSNLLDKPTSYHITNVYNDSMIHAYARMASVVPEGLKSSSIVSTQNFHERPRVLGRASYRTENIYDSVRSSSTVATAVSSRSSKSDKVHFVNGDVCSNKHQSSGSEDLHIINNSQPKNSIISMPSADIYSQIAENSYGSFALKSSRQSVQNRTVAAQRPKSVGVVTPNCSPMHLYLKPALKKTSQYSSQGSTTAESQPSLNSQVVEVEYAVVDKSKKNRFASLPALNRYNSSACMAEADDKDHPPVPPKKLLHKSDFTLYRSRSSSPKKSLLEKVQTLSRSAKSVLQKAFSTERIYRPEQEERKEASGEKTLQRSRSFIKTLTGSFRRKRRKSRTPIAEVVPQASSNPQWDETPQGPNNTLVNVRGQLLQLNLDGSQVVELTKPPSKPYGFFVARGRVRNCKGIFVSRMRDQETQKQLAGILDIGDEILEIEGSNVKNSDIMEVNDLMANKNTLLLTVLPYICC